MLTSIVLIMLLAVALPAGIALTVVLLTKFETFVRESKLARSQNGDDLSFGNILASLVLGGVFAWFSWQTVMQGYWFMPLYKSGGFILKGTVPVSLGALAWAFVSVHQFASLARLLDGRRDERPYKKFIRIMLVGAICSALAALLSGYAIESIKFDLI